MDIEEYKVIRRGYADFYPKIIEFEDMEKSVRRAGTKLGFLSEDNMIFESEAESDFFMEYLLYEKNGRKNSLVERYSFHSDDVLSAIEKILLHGMVNNSLSLFQVNRVHPDDHKVELIDLIHGGTYLLMDKGMSRTSTKGYIIFTRLLPIKDVFMTSGMIFLFSPKDKNRLLQLLPGKKKFRVRSGKPKLKAKKRRSKSLLEVMLKANEKWGLEHITEKV